MVTLLIHAAVRKSKLIQNWKKRKNKVRPRFELGSWDSESQVLTVTPSNHLTNRDVIKQELMNYPVRVLVVSSIWRQNSP